MGTAAAQSSLLFIGAATLFSPAFATDVASSEAAMWSIAGAMALLACGKAVVAISTLERTTPEVRTTPGKIARGVTLFLLGLLCAAPAAIGAAVTASTQMVLSSVFVGEVADPPVATPSETASSPEAATPTAAPTEAPGPSDTSTAEQPVPPPGLEPLTPAPTDDESDPLQPEQTARLNVLLLGVDAAPGRTTRLTDAVAVVSVSKATGDAALISIPRDSEQTPFPPGPLQDRFPDGYTGKINSIYNYGYRNSDLAPDLDNVQRGAWAISAAASELTGLRIDDWVVVDMQGFVDVTDAIGPITVWAPKSVPLDSSTVSKRALPKTLEPGWHEMDGTLALSYSRSRRSDSDFYRVVRQRCVLGAIAEQLTPTNIATSWPALLAAVQRSATTSFAQGELPELKDVAAKIDTANVRTLTLGPPTFDPYQPEVSAARSLVAATVANPNRDKGQPDSELATAAAAAQVPAPRSADSNKTASTINESCLPD